MGTRDYEKEFKILALLVSGYTLKEIAVIFDMSITAIQLKKERWYKEFPEVERAIKGSRFLKNLDVFFDSNLPSKRIHYRNDNLVIYREGKSKSKKLEGLPVGKQVGFWEVLGEPKRIKDNRAYRHTCQRCRCLLCHKSRYVRLEALKSGRSKSCKNCMHKQNV